MHNALPGIKPMDFAKLATAFKSSGCELAIVGPEAPLVGGIQDYFAKHGLLLCGPSQQAAQTEASKIWFKYLLAEAGVPTAKFAAYTRDQMQHACDVGYIHQQGPGNIVVKADGLCGGKGVFLPDTLAEVVPTCEKLHADFGEAANRFLVEDRLYGSEFSMIAMANGRGLCFLPTVQDYKRRNDSDKGSNTGGMGAYTRQLPIAIEEAARVMVADIFRTLTNRGIEYRGLIFIGFMLTKTGPMVLEMNCRGGDPEMQAILASTGMSFAQYCVVMAANIPVPFLTPEKLREAVCVNLVDPAYPDTAVLPPDTPITGINAAQKLGALVFHGGTGNGASGPVTNRADRILSVVGTGATLEAARSLAYAGVDQIRFGGAKPGYRTDIAENN